MTFKYGIVINKNSGSVTQSLHKDLTKALKDSNLDFVIKFVAGKDLAKIAQECIDDGCTAIVAGGGDGTLGSIASIAADAKIPFAVFPFGTLNHFAKDLGIPTDHTELIKMLEVGHTDKIDFGTVNDQPFLNNSSIGLYPELVIRREDREKKMGKWPAAVVSFIELWRQPLQCFELKININNKTHKVFTPFVFIGNNDYGLDKFGINRRDALDKGHLCIYIFKGERRRWLLWHAIRSVFGKPSDENLIRFESERIIIESKTPVFGVSIDGEAIELSTPLTYGIKKSKLTVIVPKPVVE